MYSFWGTGIGCRGYLEAPFSEEHVASRPKRLSKRSQGVIFS